MSQLIDALTEREKQTLRLLLTGHDAKSMARQLGLSVHTINERLREARRKLSVSSSRAAARVLHDAEATPPYFFRDEQLGEASAAPVGQSSAPSISGFLPLGRTSWIAGGLTMLIIAAALLAWTAASDTTPTAAVPQAAVARSAVAVESDAARAARQWLLLVDAQKWSESWAATGDSFRSLNTVALWQSASATARVPLGATQQRDLLDERAVPTPPSGNLVVRFQTRFANAPRSIETLALSREGGVWKVVGYYID